MPSLQTLRFNIDSLYDLVAGLRRASLVVIHAALECYLSSFAGTPRQNHEVFQPRGIMDSLLHVLSPERDKSFVHFEEAEEMRSMHIFQEECMVMTFT